MKKLLAILVFAGLVVACNNNASTKKTEDSATKSSDYSTVDSSEMMTVPSEDTLAHGRRPRE